MLPLLLTQIVFLISFVSLVVFLIRRFPRLKKLTQAELKLDTKASDQNIDFVQQRIGTYYQALQVGFFQTLTKILYWVKIFSLKVNRKTERLINKTKNKSAEIVRNGNGDLEVILNNHFKSTTQLTKDGSLIEKEVRNRFFRFLKNQPAHRRLKKKITNLKN